MGLLVVILARDEQRTIGPTVRACIKQCFPGDEVHVVADFCSDRTAVRAEAAGAVVHIRRSGAPGKGQALKWWHEQIVEHGVRADAVVVFDADSRPEPGCLAGLRAALAKGADAAQARVVPLLDQGASPTLKLAAWSEDVEQDVYDRLRAALGWPIRLRGTGMALNWPAFTQALPGLSTAVEDAELSLILAARGAELISVPEARVGDPKPADGGAASRQRARWLQGQRTLLGIQSRPILNLLLRGPAGWSLLGAIFAKPRSFILPIKAGLALVLALVFFGLGLTGWAAFAAFALLGIDMLCLALSLIRLPERWTYLGALLGLPGFIWMWCRSAVLAVRSPDPWLRARPRAFDPSAQEPEVAGP